MLSITLGKSYELFVFSSCTSSFSSIQVSSRTCHRSIQTSISSCSLLDQSSLVSHSSQNVRKPYLSVSYFKVCVLKGLPLLTCVAWTRVFFLSLSGSGKGESSIYNKGLQAVLERMGRLVCLRGCTKQCHICP